MTFYSPCQCGNYKPVIPTNMWGYKKVPACANCGRHEPLTTNAHRPEGRMESEYLKTISANLGNCRDIACDLEALARAFLTTGNERMAEQLFAYSDALQESAQKIDRAVSEEVHAEYQKTMRQTGRILDAALGASIQQGE